MFGNAIITGTFTANDMRTVQSFKLHNNGFVKYLKIELLSYYGSEHFCPISLIRVFGTSLFDEVERIDKPESKHVNVNIATEGESAFFEDSLQQPSFDIVGNAKKAVYNIVMKAFKCKFFIECCLKCHFVTDLIVSDQCIFILFSS